MGIGRHKARKAARSAADATASAAALATQGQTALAETQGQVQNVLSNISDKLDDITDIIDETTEFSGEANKFLRELKEDYSHIKAVSVRSFYGIFIATALSQLTKPLLNIDLVASPLTLLVFCIAASEIHTNKDAYKEKLAQISYSLVMRLFANNEPETRDIEGWSVNVPFA